MLGYKIILSVVLLIIFEISGYQVRPRGEVYEVASISSPTFSPTATPASFRISAVEKQAPTLVATITMTPTITPVPTLTLTPTSATRSNFEEYFDQYSSLYEVDKNQLKKIAYCESGAHPGANNGDYGGMFQFTTETWQGTRAQMGADTNPDLRFGARESIETAAFKISRGGENAWKNCI